MTDVDAKTILRQASTFARDNLAECAGELLAWRNTGLLGDGRMRELAAMLRPLSPHDHLSLAESVIVRVALERVSATPEKAAEGVPGRLAHAVKQSEAFTGTDPEAQMLADSKHLNCPACGGSGHVDDVQAQKPESVAEVYEYPRDPREPVARMLVGIRLTGMPLPVGTKLYTHAACQADGPYAAHPNGDGSIVRKDGQTRLTVDEILTAMNAGGTDRTGRL